MYGNQLYHHQHAMQRIRWERRRNLGRGSQKEIWRDSGGFLAQAGRPQSGPRSQFTDSCGSQWLAAQLLPPKPSLAPAKAMTQFSRKSLKVKVQWTWAAAAAAAASSNPQQVPPPPICSHRFPKREREYIFCQAFKWEQSTLLHVINIVKANINNEIHIC